MNRKPASSSPLQGCSVSLGVDAKSMAWLPSRSVDLEQLNGFHEGWAITPGSDIQA
jgi:hypothetical protein